MTLLGTCEGTVVDERRLHRHFQRQRIRGEWFKPSDELLQAIASGTPLTVCTAEDEAQLSVEARKLKKFEMSMPRSLWKRCNERAASRGMSLVGWLRSLVDDELGNVEQAIPALEAATPPQTE